MSLFGISLLRQGTVLLCGKFENYACVWVRTSESLHQTFFFFFPQETCKQCDNQHNDRLWVRERQPMPNASPAVCCTRPKHLMAMLSTIGQSCLLNPNLVACMATTLPAHCLSPKGDSHPAFAGSLYQPTFMCVYVHARTLFAVCRLVCICSKGS